MFSCFFAMIERKFSAKVKIVRSDNGTEFNCMKEKKFYFKHPVLIPPTKWAR
jgi:hypothetical protein